MPALDAPIFIAGHQGLIGSGLVRWFRAAGYRNLIVRTRAELELRDPEAVRRFFAEERPEYVLLAAGRVGGIVENMNRPADFLEDNLAIQSNVLGSARKSQVKRLIFFGSSCMYPRNYDGPMPETALLTAHPEPTSLPYATAKLAGLQLCLAYNRQDGGTRFVPVIPNSVYGPNDNFDPQRGHVMSALITRMYQAKRTGAPEVVLWGTGTPRREFVFADDLAAACLRLLDAEVGEVPLNIGVGEDVSIRTLAEKIAQHVGYAGTLRWDTSRPDGAPRKLLDSQRIRALGWSPVVNIDEGIARTCKWYLEHRLENV